MRKPAHSPYTEKTDKTLSTNNGFTIGSGYTEEARTAVLGTYDKYKISSRHIGGVAQTPTHRHVSKNKY